ncbi:AAA-like domain-containing protein [Clostridium hydrogenum]|uniref:AAA-like domain-containing protein n=1 Tax=Clostridium hydrogenum TaxID=2855764 RepID=UPI001F2B6FF0|nr:AAA-like domain-containing protein [Clostridium hydrogenum]
MNREFNITGTCIPEKHYMVDTSNKLDKIFKLIEKEKYFIINRPRQYGKTTTLFLLNKRLKNSADYLPIKISFEGIDYTSYENAISFINTFLQMIADNLELNEKTLSAFVNTELSSITSMNQLSKFITKLCKKASKQLVLMIDEVDKSSNNQLFLDFLGMLRNKYLLRNEGEDFTFHSVILAGVHDVKSLKLKLRPDDDRKFNSPWNIASDFDIDMSFSSGEIATMLESYIKDKKVSLNKKFFSDKLYFYTSGYPFLVSKLCKIIDEKIMNENELEWKEEFIVEAVKELLKENNTNFESLIKNLENNSELYAFIKRIVLENENISYVKTDAIVSLGTMYGILKEENGSCRVNNRIYEQLIYNHMMMKVLRKDKASLMSTYNYKENFIKEDGSLDIKKVLIKFQAFMKHEYSEKRNSFMEDDGRLIFLAFLSPIINGTGFAFKEVQGGEEKRFDIVITYEGKMNTLELKIWRGEDYHKRGILQLANYLNQYGLDKGYLLIFDLRKQKFKNGSVEEITVTVENSEKNIIEVYC